MEKKNVTKLNTAKSKLGRKLSFRKKSPGKSDRSFQQPPRSNSFPVVTSSDQNTLTRKNSLRDLLKVKYWAFLNRESSGLPNKHSDVNKSPVSLEKEQCKSSPTSGLSSFSSVDEFDSGFASDLLSSSILEDEFEFINSIADDRMSRQMTKSQTFAETPTQQLQRPLPKWKTVDIVEHHVSRHNVRRAEAKHRSQTPDPHIRRLVQSQKPKARSRPTTPDAQVVLKAKLTQLLKTTQLEQLSKLQSKHQQENDLLEDIRNFGKQKHQLEREFGQAIQKLVSQYQRKDWPLENKDSNHLSVLSVWKEVLDANEKAAHARIVAAEKYKNEIYDSIKNFQIQKDANLKKCQELLNTLQNEISDTVKDLTKSKKKYYENEMEAADRRDKFREVEERLKKNQSGIFKSKAALERTSVKLEQKRDECNKNSTVARNEYLLMLAAANAHQKRYYEQDMPECIKILDGIVYERFQDYLCSISRFELEASGIAQEACTTALQKSTMINREHSTRRFLTENPVFEWGPKYEYEVCGNDPNDGVLTTEAGAGEDNSLNREARKWSLRVVRDNRQLQRHHKLKHNLEGIKSKYKEHPEIATEANIQDTNVRFDKCKEDIRKIETSIIKSESRLKILRQTNVNVDQWLESATAQIAKECPTTPMEQKHFSKFNNQSSANGHVPVVGGDDSSFYEDEEFDDTFDETFAEEIGADEVSLSASEHSRNYPVSCTVLFGYTSTRADELTIVPGDVIEVVEDGDLEQWVKARDNHGNLGYVPENYLEFPSPHSTPVQNNTKLGAKNSIMFSSTRSTVSDTGTIGSSASNNSSTSGTSSMTSSSTKSIHEPIPPTPQLQSQSNNNYTLVKALYEYEAVTEDELSFPEGAIIKVHSQNFNEVDDGWWKGELNGKIGVFPAIVVEELVENSNSNNSNQINSHPQYDLVPGEPSISDGPPNFRPPPPTDCPPPPPSQLAVPHSTSSSVRPRTPTSPRPMRHAPPAPGKSR